MFLTDIMHVVGRHQRQTGLLGNFQQILESDFFLIQSMVENFDEKIARSEDIGIFHRLFAGFFDIVVFARFAHFAAQIAGKGNQSFAVFPQ